MGLEKYRKKWREEIAQAEARYLETGEQADLNRLNELKSAFQGTVNIDMDIHSYMRGNIESSDSDFFLNPRFATSED